MKIILPNAGGTESASPATQMEWAADTLGNTRSWAMALHGKQADKNGLPYVTHLDAVARNLYRIQGFFDLELLQAAYLHDVLEDTAAKAADLMEAGYTDRTLDAVEAVTKPKNYANYHYVEDIMQSGSDGMLVKLADLYHNTEPDRLAKLNAYQQTRLKRKYFTAIWRIETRLLSIGLLAERTITFSQTQEVWKPVVVVSAKTAEEQKYVSKWRESTSGGLLFAGDTFSWTKGGKRRKVKATRKGSAGSTIVTLEGLDEEFTLPAGAKFWMQYRPFSGVISSAAATWNDYMGLPKDYVVTGSEDTQAVSDEWYSAPGTDNYRGVSEDAADTVSTEGAEPDLAADIESARV